MTKSVHRFALWRWLLRLLVPAGMLLFGYLLLNAYQTLDWKDIRRALASYETPQVLTAIAITLLTYAAAGSYELISRSQERLALSPLLCLAVGFVAYTFAATVSALIGNWGARFRLYARRGVPLRQTTRVAVLSISTNWSGFVLLAGSIFLLLPPALPASWPVNPLMLRATGFLLLCSTVAYVIWCWRCAGRSWRIRNLRFTVPRGRTALMQLAVSSLVWLGMAAVLSCFLPPAAALPMVLAALFLSTVATLVIRIPAGVGVTEFVFVALMSPALGTSTVIAALLAWRAVFQLLPLLLAAAVYLLLELGGRRLPASPTESPQLESL